MVGVMGEVLDLKFKTDLSAKEAKFPRPAAPSLARLHSNLLELVFDTIPP
jgi:hypothetical protein